MQQSVKVAVAMLLVAGVAVGGPGAQASAADIVVTTLVDVVDASDGEVSLREAVDIARGDADADRITFADGLIGTINLDSALLVSTDIEIAGPGRDVITIASDAVRGTLWIVDGASIAISGITVSGEESAIYAGYGVVGTGSTSAVALVDMRAIGGVLLNVLESVDIRGSVFEVDVVGAVRGVFIGSRVATEPVTVNIADSTFVDLPAGVLSHVTGDVTIDGVEARAARVAVRASGDVTIRNSTFADSPSDGLVILPRSAVLVEPPLGTVVIENSAFVNNRVIGVYLQRPTQPVEIRDSTIEGSRRGIAHWSSQSLSVIDTHILGSTQYALRGTQGFGGPSGPIRIEGSTLSGSGWSAVRIVSDSELTMTNSTITGNAAADDLAVVTILHSTIASNGVPGQLAPVLDGPGVTVDHSIVSGNSARPLFDEDVVITNSLVPTGWASGANLEVDDPGLGELAANGGAVPTLLPQPGSPAVDGGDSGSISAPTVDQRGLPRIVGIDLDIGSVERQADEVLVTTTIPATSTPPTTDPVATVPVITVEPSSELPATGSNRGNSALLAALLLAGGVVLLRLSRRRA